MKVYCPYCGETMMPATDRELGLEYYFCPVCLSQSAAVRRITDPNTGEDYTVSFRNGDRGVTASEAARYRTFIPEYN